MKRLEFERRNRGLGIRGLSRIAHVDTGCICRAENESPHLSAGQLTRIARALEYTGDPATLLDDVEVV